MSQAIQNTDAWILRQFDAASKPLRPLPAGPELTNLMGHVAAPFFQRLLRNGHSKADAASLLQATFQHNPPKEST